MRDYDTLREKLDLQYENAVYQSGCGMEREAVNRAIRAIYVTGENAKASFPVTRAKMLAFALENIRIAVADFDEFACVCERPNEILRIQNERYNGISRQKIGENLSIGQNAERDGVYIAHLDLSHTVPDWDRLLNLGISGLLALAERRFAEAPSPFTESVLIIYRAFRVFVLRFAAAARLVKREDIADMTEFLTDHAPETLQQALELSLLYSEAQHIEGENLRSMGIFDRHYHRFYENDLAQGHLTEQSVRDLLTIYFSHFHARSHGLDAGTPFCFGGRLADGRDNCNSLTRLCWEAFRRIGQVDPKFSLRVNRDTPDELLLQIAECIREGKTATLFANEEIAEKMFRKHGKDESDLCNFVPVGCYEPAIMGKELSCTMTVWFNLSKIIELMMRDREFNPASFEEVLNRYLSLLREKLTEAMAQAVPWEHLWNDINPAPLLSGTMEECMSRGLDVSQFGTKYATSGVMCAGIGTVTDSLSAIESLVFDQKELTFRQLQDILASNWINAEELRQKALKRTPKWGCGDPRADRLAQAVVAAAADRIEQTPNAKGGRYQMGLWSIDWILGAGKLTGATPDGRHNGDVLSKNTGSTIGCDREGIAGLMESVTKLDATRFADGTVLDVMLPQSTVAGKDGAKFICQLVRSFFAMGGFFIHFNILSSEHLRKAQRNPDAWRNLQIRLCGWNVRFIDLPVQMQDCLIREAESKEA